jgi:chemotaxis response regulator CheB
VPNIIVIGASAGGIEALNEIISLLPVDFQAAIFVVAPWGFT